MAEHSAWGANVGSRNLLNWRPKILLLVLLVTSFSSIVYEVVWGRELSHVFGTSAFAITTVLTTFMAGLALGSLYGGRLIEKVRRKYLFLAATEILIGLSCLGTLYLLKLVIYPYFWIYEAFQGNSFLFTMVLFILSFFILIIPTFLIGVAFPTVVKLYFNELKEMGKSVGRTYMFDTIGGAVGALATGFFLVMTFGFFRTSLIASALNIFVGIALFWLFWKAKFKQAAIEKARETKTDGVILILFFLSGFAALMFEVIWTRHIALIYGSSTQSFAIVLAAFLAGLGIGSAIASRYIDRVKNKIILFAFIELFIGIIGMCLVVAFPAMEKWFMYLYFHSSSYNVFTAALFIACFIIILLPTTLMGATLPVLAAIYASDKKAGSDVGKLYSVNSFGSILGAFMAGFVIIPATGLAQSSILAGIIYIAIALAFIYYFTDELPKSVMKNVLMLLTVILVCGFTFLLAFYQPNYLYKGVYYHGIRQVNESVIFESSIEESMPLVFHANSPYGQVSVFRKWDGSYVWLKNNGKTDASTGDMLTQGMISHVPLLVHKNPKSVLQIGMGGAFSLASSLKYSEVEQVDAIEIDPMVALACKTALAEFNDYALEDLRTNVIVADGRNYLFSTDKKYDIIVSEPPNIWVSGVSSLFTVEYYNIVKARLKKDGLFSQWLPYYEMSEKDYKIALNTLHSVFPYLYEFNLGGDIIILASEKKIDIYEAINRQRLLQHAVDSDFTTMIGVSEKKTEYSEEDYDPYERNYNFLVSYYYKGPSDVEQYIKGVEVINTDDLPILEFSTLRDKYPRFRG